MADPLVVYPRDGTRTLSIIKQSNGVALAVQENQIVPLMETLARYEGICAESASALPIGAIEYWNKKCLLNPDDMIVLLITGHGAKGNLK